MKPQETGARVVGFTQRVGAPVTHPGAERRAVTVCCLGSTVAVRTLAERWVRGTSPGQTETNTVCAHRGVGCTLMLRVQDNGIVKVTSPYDDPVTHGDLRSKGRFGCQHVQNRG